MTVHIQSPFEWAWDRLKASVSGIGSTRPDEYWPQANLHPGVPVVRRIGVADLRVALARGFDDFGANRDDVIFLCVIYPVIGLVLGRLAFGYGMLPLLFPLAAGFTLVGPLAAIGLNEMSRRREQDGHVTWMDAFGVLHSPSLAAIAQLGALLLAIFAVWLVVADSIYNITLGPEPPVSISAFARDVLTTEAGWVLIGAGIGVGSLFAVAVLAISVVSFPLLLDSPVSAATDRVDPLLHRPRDCLPGARARNLAPVAQGGATLTRFPSDTAALAHQPRRPTGGRGLNRRNSG